MRLWRIDLSSTGTLASDSPGGAWMEPRLQVWREGLDGASSLVWMGSLDGASSPGLKGAWMEPRLQVWMRSLSVALTLFAFSRCACFNANQSLYGIQTFDSFFKTIDNREHYCLVGFQGGFNFQVKLKSIFRTAFAHMHRTYDLQAKLRRNSSTIIRQNIAKAWI